MCKISSVPHGNAKYFLNTSSSFLYTIPWKRSGDDINHGNFFKPFTVYLFPLPPWIMAVLKLRRSRRKNASFSLKSVLYSVYGVTESQNHRMVRVGRKLCGSSSTSPLLKQGHLQQAAQDLVQAGLEYVQRRRLHHLTGQPVPGLRYPQREEVPPHVQTELPVLQFVPIAPCPVARHYWKELGPTSKICKCCLKLFLNIWVLLWHNMVLL